LFDAISVLFTVLLKELKKEEERNDENQIYEGLFDCLYDFTQFAKWAMAAGNGDGACLPVVDLKNCFDELSATPPPEAAQKLMKDSIGLLIGLGLAAAGRPDSDVTASFLKGRFDTHGLDVLAQVPASYSSTFEAEVIKNFLKHDVQYDHDAALSWLRSLGRVRGSNFGLNLN
jgi:hypothetical protein